MSSVGCCVLTDTNHAPDGCTAVLGQRLVGVENGDFYRVSLLLRLLLWRPRLTWLLCRWVGVHLPGLLLGLPRFWRHLRRLLRTL